MAPSMKPVHHCVPCAALTPPKAPAPARDVYPTLARCSEDVHSATRQRAGGSLRGDEVAEANAAIDQSDHRTPERSARADRAWSHKQRDGPLARHKRTWRSGARV